mmetsp:Transcript_10540/g.16324  ORF Transcript_10540/g.16324 Transcript_10540/m.16324 type:complete len:111 (-) Transcript_10540:39-371(-)
MTKTEYIESWDRPTSCIITLNHRGFRAVQRQFPNIHKILQILAICPVTTAGVERGNSMLKLIKTSIRSTIGPDNLNAFCKMRWFYKDKVDVDEVIRKWSRKRKRNIAFSF